MPPSPRGLGRSPSAAFVRRLIKSMPPWGGGLAAAVLVEPAIGRYANKRLAVIEARPESGRTVQAADGARVRVTMSADRARFESSLRLDPALTALLRLRRHAR